MENHLTHTPESLVSEKKKVDKSPLITVNSINFSLTAIVLSCNCQPIQWNEFRELIGSVYEKVPLKRKLSMV